MAKLTVSIIDVCTTNVNHAVLGHGAGKKDKIQFVASGTPSTPFKVKLPSKVFRRHTTNSKLTVPTRTLTLLNKPALQTITNYIYQGTDHCTMVVDSGGPSIVIDS